MDTSWMSEAKCKGLTELFFVERFEYKKAEEAKKVCEGCPVRQECLEYAIVNVETDGIWGGLSPKKRRPIRSQWVKDQGSFRNFGEIEHGTRRGYRMHLRRKESACASCQAANWEYVRERRQEQAASGRKSVGL